MVKIRGQKDVQKCFDAAKLGLNYGLKLPKVVQTLVSFALPNFKARTCIDGKIFAFSISVLLILLSHFTDIFLGGTLYFSHCPVMCSFLFLMQPLSNIRREFLHVL